MQIKNNIFTLALFLTIACAPKNKDNSNSEAKSPNSADASAGLSYRFNGINQNGEPCTTGEQSFPNRGEYCKALLDEELNLHCAFDQRSTAYSTACTGKAGTADIPVPENK